MPSYQVPGLGQRTLRMPVNEHRRCPKRPQYKEVIPYRQVILIQKADQPYTQESPQERPRDILFIHQRLPVDHIPGNPVSSLDTMFHLVAKVAPMNKIS